MEHPDRVAPGLRTRPATYASHASCHSDRCPSSGRSCRHIRAYVRHALARQTLASNAAIGFRFVAEQTSLTDVHPDSATSHQATAPCHRRTRRSPSTPPDFHRCRTACSTRRYRRSCACGDGKQFNTLDNSDPSSHAYTGTSPFFVVDLRAKYRHDAHWSAAPGVDNLGDRTYWNFHPYNQRTWVAELRYDY